MTRKKKKLNFFLIFLGAILITFSIVKLVDYFSLVELIFLSRSDTIDQEGFLPVIVPGEEIDNSFNDIDDIPSEIIPERIRIEEISLEAPIVLSETYETVIGGRDILQFLVPEEFAAGWHQNSAPLGMVGNTVLSGHHNAYGKVFENLVDLERGSEIILENNGTEYRFLVAQKMILPDAGETLHVRIDNGRWIMPSDDERVTLVTCWPKNANTHRLIIIAFPESEFE